MNQSPCYQQGRIYGQDVSSGAAVAALLSDHHNVVRKEGNHTSGCRRVLDMCCAPGLKLCAIADWMRQNSCGESVVVGVDCSESRLALCRKIIEKYQIEPFVVEATESEQEAGDSSVRVRLYHNDGTKFGRDEASNLIFDSSVATQQRVRLGKRKRRSKKTRNYELKLLKGLAFVDYSDPTGDSATAVGHHEVQLFDRVLVDAECSTDGSLRHMQERLHKEQEASGEAGQTNPSLALTNTQLTNEKELAELVTLQRELAATGFRLLKKGGCMVYSTCSLSEEQNEGVVRWLLAQNPKSASIVPLSFEPPVDEIVESKKTSSIREGSLSGTIRFFPIVSEQPNPNTSASESPNDSSTVQNLYGGGFFLAKVQKSL